MFGWELPPSNSGGLGVACLGLARALVYEGVDIIFVLPRTVPVFSFNAHVIFADTFLPPLEKGLPDTSAAYRSANYDRYKNKKSGESSNKSEGHTLIDEVFWYGKAARKIAKHVPHDIIHAHDWLSYEAGMQAKQASGKPLVVHVHATEFDRTGNGHVNQNVYDIERAGMHTADQIFAVSEYTKNIVVSHYGVSPNKVSVVHNGIDADDMTIVKKTEDALMCFKIAGNKIVLFAGRLTIQKGPDHFVEIAHRVLKHRPNTIFIISGSGDMDQQIIDQAAYLGISDHIFFAGFLRGEELGRIYKCADLYVMPSVSEPFGIIPLESLMNGTPVLVSKQSGISEVLRHALKADFWDYDDMTDKIISTLDHDSLQKDLSKNGGREARNQKWQKAAQTCKSAYQSIINIFSK